MNDNISRRAVLFGAVLFPAGLMQAARGSLSELDRQFGQLEKTVGGRLGVATLDTESGAGSDHRAGERFPMCSTFKLLAVAGVLARVDRGRERLAPQLALRTAEPLGYAPSAAARVA